MAKKIIDLSMDSEELTPYFVTEIDGKEIKVGLEPLQVFGMPVWTKGRESFDATFPDSSLTGWKHCGGVSFTMEPILHDVDFVPRLRLADSVDFKDFPIAICNMETNVDLLIPIGLLRDVNPRYEFGKDYHKLTVDIVEEVIKCNVVGNTTAVMVQTELWEDLQY